MNDYIFSLDVGTRKIAAYIAVCNNGNIELLADKIVEHQSRAVIAGQIQDIEKVSEIVKEIKKTLESETGIIIEKAATAIAGRNLKSFRDQGEIKFKLPKEITSEDMRQAELAGINSVISNHEQVKGIDGHYFIGHTVVKWMLDGEEVLDPLGHYANSISTEIIATFLPRVVLESLFSVMKKVGLEVSYITLEPIAAVEAVLPPNIRNFPVALVDIGAGTSDIAFIVNGSIQSFGMIPIAGDIITEAVCNEYFVDFSEAERMKKSFGNAFACGCLSSEIHYKNIFEKVYCKTAFEIMEKIVPVIRVLAKGIACEIGSLISSQCVKIQNYAVVLVGGGSLTPLLETELSELLGIPKERIGVRAPYMMEKFVYPSKPQEMLGPHTAVALGTAALSSRSPSIILMHVTINNKKMELLNINNSEMTVISALLAAGINRQKLYGRPGLAKVVTLNGEKKVLKGLLPRPAQILINNEATSFNNIVKEGDIINFIPAFDGKNAEGKIRDLLPEQDKFILNGEKILFPFEITVNGNNASMDSFIEDNDVIEFKTHTKLMQVLAGMGIAVEGLYNKSIKVDVLDNEVEKTAKNYVLKHNGAEITNINDAAEICLNPLDTIDFNIVKPVLRVKDFISLPESGKELKVMINNEEFVFPGISGKILLNGKEVDEDTEVNDGDIIRTTSGRDAEAVLVDIFRYIPLEPKENAGKRLKLLVNEEEANFTTPLSYGAKVKIAFE